MREHTTPNPTALRDRAAPLRAFHGPEWIAVIRIEESRYFPIAREDAFDYVTDPHSWRQFWPDIVAIPELDVARWRQPGDTIRLRMRLAGRVVDLHMTLDRLNRPSLVEYHTVQRGLPDAEHVRVFEPAGAGFIYRLVVGYRPRRGASGLLDRTLVRRGIHRALRTTLSNLDRGLLVHRCRITAAVSQQP